MPTSFYEGAGGQSIYAGIVWRGPWGSSAAYSIGDAVYYNGSSYVCIAATTNNVPPNATYWSQLVSGRQFLTEDTIWHASTIGNDANDGSAGSPWRTLQHAFDYVGDNIDGGGNYVIVQCSDGDYDGFNVKTFPVNTRGVVLKGNAANRQSVRVKNSGSSIFNNTIVSTNCPTYPFLQLHHLSVLATANSINGVISYSDGKIYLADVEFKSTAPTAANTCVGLFSNAGNAALFGGANYSFASKGFIISGYDKVGDTTSSVWYEGPWACGHGAFQCFSVAQLTGTHRTETGASFSGQFILVAQGALVDADSAAYAGAGAFTGKRYLVHHGGQYVPQGNSNGDNSYVTPGDQPGENHGGFYGQWYGAELSVATQDTSNPRVIRFTRLQEDATWNVISLNGSRSNSTLVGLVGGQTGNESLNLHAAATGSITLQIAGVTGAQLDPSGRFIIGNSAAANGDALQVLGTGFNSSQLSVWRFSNDNSPPNLGFHKGRGATLGASGTVQVGDQIGAIQWWADVGDGIGNETPGASITAILDASSSSFNAPMALIFGAGTNFSSPERLRIDSTGRSRFTGSNGTTTAPPLVDSADSNISLIADSNKWGFTQYTIGANSGAQGWVTAKTRGADVTTHTILHSGDTVLTVAGYGSDGTDYKPVAFMQVKVDGTPGTGSMPGRWQFYTTPSGSTTPLERLRLDNAGRLTKGGVASQFNFGFETHGTSFNTSAAAFMNWSADTNAANFQFFKSRAASIGGATIVQDGDDLGVLQWMGDDGQGPAGFAVGARISAQVDGAGAANWSIPGRLLFWTSPSGGSCTEAMRIDSHQNVIIGTGAIATNASNGFLYIETFAGTPTGTPTSYTGRVALGYDTTNNKLYAYNGAWKAVTLT